MSERQHIIEDKGVALAHRYFYYDVLQPMYREQQAAIEAREKARIAHERAQEHERAIDKKIAEARWHFAARALEAVGLRSPDPSFDEAFAYKSDGDTVVVVRRKKADAAGG